MESYRTLLGIVLVLYGIGKIIISTAIFVLPEKYLNKIPFVKHDTTPAGIAIDGVLLVFGIYTILHGLAILGLMFASGAAVLDSIITVYILYTMMGIFMLTFFSLIVYTKNPPIKHNPKQLLTYEIVGVGGGILFLVTVTIMALWRNFGYNITTVLSATATALLFTGLGLLIANAIYAERRRRKTPPDVKINVAGELITLAMVPLGAI